MTIKENDTVKVYNHKLSGERFLEGEAKVILIDGENVSVAFDGDEGVFTRRIANLELV